MSPIRNVLFIAADQWRGDCLSALGHPCLETPALDRLAAGGTTFRRHYGQATPCGPGRTCLHTGLYLMNHRSVVSGAPLDARHTNIALEARKAGHAPALFGYTDTTPDPRGLPDDHPSLKSYEGVLPGIDPVLQLDSAMRPWIDRLAALGYGDLTAGEPLAEATVFRPRDGAGAGRGATFAPTLYDAEHSHTVFVTDAVLAYLTARAGQPWFVHVSYFAPHPPFIVPAPYHARYDPADVPAPARGASRAVETAQHPWLAFYLPSQEGTGYTYGATSGCHADLDDNEMRQLRATYYGMQAEVDDQIGRLLDHLDDAGLADDTLVVFTSDHGEMLGDHWLLHKYGYFDQAFHIPLIVRDPDAGAGTRGRVVDRFSEAVDVMPTILDWLGQPAPAQCDGLSLMPFCRGETPARWRAAVHWEYDFRNVVSRRYEDALGLTPDQCTMCVIRDERGKYVHFTALPPVFFDLEDDPSELVNRAADPARRATVLDYAQRMLSWRMNHADRTLANTLLTANGPVRHEGPRW